MEGMYDLESCNNLTNKEIRRLYRDHVNPALEDVFGSFAIGEEVADHAEGVWIYTKDGKKILDATGGIGVLNTGHNHPRILKVRQEYLKRKYMEVHKTIFSPYLAGLSHNLAKVLPGDLDYPYFCNSGAEAVEGAMKLAYKYHEGKRRYIIHSDISFHGKLLGTGSISSSKEVYFKYQRISDTEAFKYNSIESVKELIDKLRKENGESDIYSLIVEPYSASTHRGCSGEFLRAARKLCEKEDIVLIFDEIYTGWCKTGNLFYFMDHDVVPDILTTSKSLGGGKSSISAYIARKPVLMKAYGRTRDATLHTTTYNGFGEECVTAMEAINLMIEENFVEKSRRAERSINERAKKLLEKYPDQLTEYRGVGVLHGFFLKADSKMLGEVLRKLPVSISKDERFLPKFMAAAFCDWLFRKHDIYILFTATHDVAVTFSPSVIIGEEEIERFFAAMEESLKVGSWKIAANFVLHGFANYVTKIVK